MATAKDDGTAVIFLGNAFFNLAVAACSNIQVTAKPACLAACLAIRSNGLIECRPVHLPAHPVDRMSVWLPLRPSVMSICPSVCLSATVVAAVVAAIVAVVVAAIIREVL